MIAFSFWEAIWLIFVSFVFITVLDDVVQRHRRSLP